MCSIEDDDMTDSEFGEKMDLADHCAETVIDELLGKVREKTDLDPDLAMYALWMYSTRYLAEAGYTATSLQEDVLSLVEHQTSTDDNPSGQIRGGQEMTGFESVSDDIVREIAVNATLRCANRKGLCRFDAANEIQQYLVEEFGVDWSRFRGFRDMLG